MKSFFEYKHHSRTWTQHNDPRVSRILKCLILKGLHAEAGDFYGFVSTLRGDHSSSIEHWQLAMRDALPRASQAVASAQKEGEGSGHVAGLAADNNYVHHMKSMKDLEHQLKRNLM